MDCQLNEEFSRIQRLPPYVFNIVNDLKMEARHRGEDIRDLYSEIEVVVRGEPGEGLDRFLRALRIAFGEHELLLLDPRFHFP